MNGSCCPLTPGEDHPSRESTIFTETRNKKCINSKPGVNFSILIIKEIKKMGYANKAT